MHKRLLTLVGAAVLLALPLPLSADSAVQSAVQAPVPAQTQASQAPVSAQTLAGTPRDYYKLGEFFQTTTNSQYFETASMDLLQQKFARERQILVNLGGSQAVLADYDKVIGAFLQLPFTIPWPSWTQNQQNTFISTQIDWSTVNAWLPAGDTMPRFYFWLGFQTMFVVKTGPLDLNQWNYSLATVQGYYQGPLLDFKSFATIFPNSLKTTPSAVQQAIQALAAYYGKTPSTSDMAAMQAQGEVIYEAENGKSSP
jgi:hypothetical protein